jgi:hypothetical protein
MPIHRSAVLERPRLLLGALLVIALVAATTPPRASTAAGTGALPQVPAGLTALESNAEDLVDDALGHDRARVIATANALSASAGPTTGKTLLAAGVPAKQVALVRARVARVARDAHARAYVVVALDANAVSSAVTELYVHFADRVPIAVRRLDTIDRDAQLRSLAGQRAAVPLAVAQLAQTWAPLRQHVIDHGGQSVAAAYARHVAAMKRLAPASGSAFRNEAVNGLNIVDELEGVFN